MEDDWMKEYIPSELFQLADGASEIKICELSKIGDLRNSHNTIAALIERRIPSFRIGCKGAAEFNGNQAWGLDAEIPICCPWPSIQIQLEEILDNTFILDESICDQYIIYDGNICRYKMHRNFNPKEIIPPAGSGVIAVICNRDDKELRKN